MKGPVVDGENKCVQKVPGGNLRFLAVRGQFHGLQTARMPENVHELVMGASRSRPGFRRVSLSRSSPAAPTKMRVTQIRRFRPEPRPFVRVLVHSCFESDQVGSFQVWIRGQNLRQTQLAFC